MSSPHLSTQEITPAANIDVYIDTIVSQLRGNLATIRAFLHLLEMEKPGSQPDLVELQHKLENHLETKQTEVITLLKALSKTKALEN